MNKKLSAIITILLFVCSNLFAGELTLKGNYYGFNLQVLNPSNGNGFCVTEVLVNNQKTQDEVNSNAFEIDFSLLNLKIGDPVTVVIKHHNGCVPEVINPRALQPTGNVSFITPKADKTGHINWGIKGDLMDEPLIIEQFRWNKWTKVGEFTPTDTVKKNMYSFEFIPHTGLNQFRIFFNDVNGNPMYSKIIKYTSRNPEITLLSAKTSDKLTFSANTQYEIFDLKGNFISEGFGKEIDVTDLEKGKYWLNYDNKSVNFTKK
ncbi:MAG TPA: hypothetical protein PLB59_02260 [Bacteroidales bacterium]|nr:hypothetical protein [Bacteroidales bacterium]HQN16083.1 hypothetical protein [Bacteroidales bacterium]HQP14765.1 hypothetical protein [Bacteroidales bacterium]